MLTRERIDKADLIVVMTRGHQEQIMYEHPDAADKVPPPHVIQPRPIWGADVPDPIGQSVVAPYRHIRDMLDSAVAELILLLIEQKHLIPIDEKQENHMRVAIAADHGGLNLKESLKQVLADRDIEVIDLGTNDKTSVDYPDYAEAVARVPCPKATWIKACWFAPPGLA